MDHSEIPNTAQPAKESSAESLSERELAVMRLIAAGLSNRAIAEQLFIAVGTVKWYLKHIYSKLHVNSRTQAILRAKERGLL